MEQEKGKANSPANEPESWQEKMVLTFGMNSACMGYPDRLILTCQMVEELEDMRVCCCWKSS